jgi:formamidopyrimidine-DNA glycosylase
MPELPEVETIRQDLRNKIINKKIVDVLVTSKAKVKPSKYIFIKHVKDNKFIEIDRIGKLLIFVMPEQRYLLVHLKMTGQFIYKKDNEIIPGGHNDLSTIKNLPNNSTHITFEFLGKEKLYFNDMRRFGYMKLVGSDELEKVKSNYGIEPLQSNFVLKDFKELFKNRKTSVKALLLNQKIISGIGNIYADESCFLSGIKPERRACELSHEELKKLYLAIQKIIKKAVKIRGTSFNNYVDADGNKGSFVKFLKVYGRGGLKCTRCHGILIKTKTAGRGTVYCAKCQK